MTRARILSLAAICLCLPTPTISSLTAFDCSTYNSLKHVHISDILPQCDTITDAETVGVTIFEPLGPTTVMGYRCKVTFTQTLVDVGSSRVVSNGTETINRDDCLEAHLTKTITLSGNRIPFLDTNGTVNHTMRLTDHNIAEGNSLGNHTRQYYYIRTYEITLSENVGTVDLQQNIIRLDNDVICDNDEYSCHDDEFGHIFWKPVDVDNAYSLIYEGRISLVRAKFPVNPEIHYAVITHPFNDEVFVVEAYDVNANGSGYEHRIFRVVDIPNTFIMVSDEVGYFGSYWGWNTDGVFRNTYSEPHYGKDVQAVDIVKRCCERQKQHQYSLLKSLPMFSRISFAQKGLVGRKAIEFLVIEQCDQQEVTSRRTEECFSEIPVKDKQNRDRFLDPNTRVLSSRAERVPCKAQGRTSGELQTSSEALQTGEKTSTEPFRRVESSHRSKSETSEPVDWVKIIALAVLCGWACAVLVRLVSMAIHCISKRRAQQNENAENPPIFSVSALAGVFKPPLTRDLFKWKRHHDEKEPEVSVSYAV